jgi:hypothetical protein
MRRLRAGIESGSLDAVIRDYSVAAEDSRKSEVA